MEQEGEGEVEVEGDSLLSRSSTNPLQGSGILAGGWIRNDSPSSEAG